MSSPVSRCFFDIDQAVNYRKSLHIVAETIGTLSHSPTQEISLGPPFYLSDEQIDYIRHRNVEELTPKSRLFRELTQSGYYVVSGTIYGCDYMIYEGDPLVTHATALVFLERELHPMRIVEITRLAALCKKMCLIAYFQESNLVIKKLERLQLERPHEKRLPRIPQ